MNKFEALYNKIAISKNYIEPTYPRMDNWSLDRYETADGMFTGTGDAGYSKWVGKRVDGKVVWRVSEYYPKPIEYSGITEENFNKVVDDLLR